LKKLYNTRRTSTLLLPRLERLLLDADVSAEVEPLLRAVGFHTEFALRVSVNIRSDLDILRWARKSDYIVVCHDKFKDKQTRSELYPELFHRGGKIIQVGGGPSQDPYTSLGKILVHRKTWLEWFKDHDGIVVVHSEGINLRDSSNLFEIVQKRMPLATDPIRTLKARKHKPLQRTKRQSQIPLGQQSFIN
jgi:hypothetical protein